VLFADKTGTLTENKIGVAAMRSLRKERIRIAAGPGESRLFRHLPVD
jgi:magnesium-transporting ATPase (P-type)